MKVNTLWPWGICERLWCVRRCGEAVREEGVRETEGARGGVMRERGA